MSKWMKLGGTTAFAALMTGSAAFADVTAQDVWGDWKAYMEGFGYGVTGTEATSGGTLTVSDITMTMALPEDAGMLKMTMAEMNFTNNDDGTVTVGFPASQEVDVNVAPAGEGPVDLAFDYSNQGMKMVVSGSMNDMAYAYGADEIKLALKSVTAEGKTVPVKTAMLAAHDINGSSMVKTGNLRTITQSMTASDLALDVDFANPDNAEDFVKIGANLGQPTFNGTISIPSGDFDANNMAAMLKAGFAVDGKYGYTGGNMDFQFVESGSNVQTKSSSDSGAFEVAMSEDVLKYLISAKGQKVNMVADSIPFPIDVTMAQSLLKLVMPVSKSDEMRDFALGITLGGFETSDMIWGLIDPEAKLPHDPATVAIDLSGKAKLGFDIMDPEQQKAMESGELGMPGEVESLALNNLEVTAAGASLTGKGAFAFDFPTVMKSQGMQGVDGTLDLNLTGANGLMGKLVDMGLVPQDQIMGVQMMMGMFAVPAGDDAYTSKLEVKPDGQVLANGQRLK